MTEARYKWQLRYEKSEDGEISSVTTDLTRNGNRIQLTLPSDTAGYTVELLALGGVDSEPLCNPFTIALRRKEHLVFNGSSLQWFDKDGKEVPFKVDDTTSVNALKAFTGSADLQPPEGQDKVNEGPIPEGIWWLKRDNLQCIDDLGFWRGTFGRTWPGGVERWGRYRLWLEHDPETKNQGRTNLCVLGNESRNTGGNIHIFDSETDFTDMEVFKKNFVKRVESGGRLKMRVNYAKSYKKGDTGNDVLEINFRLTGFGGVLPNTEFTELTEKGVKQFQRDYMGMDTSTGIVDVNTLEAIDEFSERYRENVDDYKCSCGKCGGFGNGQYKGVYRDNEPELEMFHHYEYPGMHQSLLWAVSAARFYLTVKLGGEYSVKQIYSAYRCWANATTIRTKTTNHMGKAVDIHFNKNGSRTRDVKDMDILREKIFCECIGAPKQIRNSIPQFGWLNNQFGLESAAVGATTWVHLDVREFDTQPYLNDMYFVQCNSEKTLV
ncbi:hypothetical protein QA601_18170 [Chitinispirillales bacterium ANBcel5]|uniref:peptidoglycan-binding domain-containing protein n=1 Tax=Cellulosispirillum alkaliphilum TaxID=3039283 RepID=UPI002A500B9C|nr:hypothetical protein [Chitinispirillales bacterium ANBcel5]